MCVCVCVWECVKGLEHHQTVQLPHSGQDNALLFVFFCCILLRGFFFLFWFYGGVLFFIDTPRPLLLSTLQSDRFEHRARERKERRGRSELFGQMDAPGRMWRFAALWVCRIGPATQTHSQPAWEGKISLPHTHTHSSTPHPLQLLSILHPLSSPHLLPVAAPYSPSLLNKERFRGEGVKGARGNSYVCMWKWAMADTWTVAKAPQLHVR